MGHFYARNAREAAYSELPILDDAFDEILDPTELLVIDDGFGALLHDFTSNKDVVYE